MLGLTCSLKNGTLIHIVFILFLVLFQFKTPCFRMLCAKFPSGTGITMCFRRGLSGLQALGSLQCLPSDTEPLGFLSRIRPTMHSLGFHLGAMLTMHLCVMVFQYMKTRFTSRVEALPSSSTANGALHRSVTLHFIDPQHAAGIAELSFKFRLGELTFLRKVSLHCCALNQKESLWLSDMGWFDV